MVAALVFAPMFVSAFLIGFLLKRYNRQRVVEFAS
jgi:hypothetical protein